MRFLLITWCGNGRVQVIREPDAVILAQKCGYRCTLDHELIQLGEPTRATTA